MRHHAIWIKPLLLILSSWQLSAQDYILDVQQFGIEDGLYHRGVLSVFEDKDGIIWLGGFHSLQRYDGHGFKTWTRADRTGLFYSIHEIGQDDEGWLWIWNSAQQEIVFLHPVTEEILSPRERFGERFPDEVNVLQEVSFTLILL